MTYCSICAARDIDGQLGMWKAIERDILLVVPFARTCLKHEICLAEPSILKCELHGTTVHTGAQTVSLVSEPRNSAIQLALNCGSSLRIPVTLVKKEWSSIPTIVRKLWDVSCYETERKYMETQLLLGVTLHEHLRGRGVLQRKQRRR